MGGTSAAGVIPLLCAGSQQCVSSPLHAVWTPHGTGAYRSWCQHPQPGPVGRTCVGAPRAQQPYTDEHIARGIAPQRRARLGVVADGGRVCEGGGRADGEGLQALFATSRPAAGPAGVAHSPPPHAVGRCWWRSRKPMEGRNAMATVSRNPPAKMNDSQEQMP